MESHLLLKWTKYLWNGFHNQTTGLKLLSWSLYIRKWSKWERWDKMPLDTQVQIVLIWLLTQNGGITGRKTSKLHMPHNTNRTFIVTYGNPVSSFSMYMWMGTFSFVAYTTIWLMKTSALSGEEVALMWKIILMTVKQHTQSNTLTSNVQLCNIQLNISSFTVNIIHSLVLC